MRRVWCAIITALFVSGCAAWHTSISAVDACRADAECSAQMDAAAQAARVATAAATESPAAIAVGALASMLTGLIAGRKLRR